ncbi:hypothetical protein TWF696_007707 [Orbilia brochopaga]|uniref:ATPase AAA-type core domain-containing protein n=1 Tax=Orbilia brochopaga TaxID=3140254 RepID=A0AAV9US51_9PEZI
MTQTPVNRQNISSCTASDYKNVLLRSILKSRGLHNQHPEETSSISEESTSGNSAPDGTLTSTTGVSTGEIAPGLAGEESVAEHTTKISAPETSQNSLLQKPGRRDSFDNRLQGIHDPSDTKKHSHSKPRRMALVITGSDCSDEEWCELETKSKSCGPSAYSRYNPYGDKKDHHLQEEDLGGGLTESPFTHKHKMSKWSRSAENKFERMLLDIIVNTDGIPQNYENIFIDKRTIRKLEHVTTLSLTRPKAFKHGVLRDNRVTGAVLYGPPGTGKTLLTKAMARQAGFNMLAASTSELWRKCHGEDEKASKFCSQ